MGVDRMDNPCWYVTCDDCGDTYGGEEFSTMHFESESEAITAIRDSGYYHEHGGEIVCEGCHDERKEPISE